MKKKFEVIKENARKEIVEAVGYFTDHGDLHFYEDVKLNSLVCSYPASEWLRVKKMEDVIKEDIKAECVKEKMPKKK